MFTEDMWNRLSWESEFMDTAMTLIKEGALTPEHVTIVFNEAREELKVGIAEVEKFAEARGVTCRVQWNDYDVLKITKRILGIMLSDIGHVSRWSDGMIQAYSIRRSLEQAVNESAALIKVLATATKNHAVKVEERQFRHGIDEKCIIEKYANGNRKVNAAEHMNTLILMASKTAKFLDYIDKAYPINRCD